MALIRSHQWLALDALGDTARDARTTRSEDRELLGALTAGPVRMVDLFRRLRQSDSNQFQDLLGRAVGRGWVQVHEQDPRVLLDVDKVEPVQDAPSDPASALEALLARYNVQEDAPAAAPEPPATVPVVVASPSPVAPSLPPAPESSSDEASGEDWMSALGVSVPTRPSQADPTTVQRLVQPERPFDLSEPTGAHAELLRALAHAPPSAVSRPAVHVPEYGLAPSVDQSPASQDFVRLKDVGAVRGPGDGPPTDPKSAPTPLPAPGTTPSVRSRRQHNGREQFLAAARRNAAARDDARTLAERNKQEQKARKEQELERVAEQKKQEQAQRRPSLREHAERARRIRDGHLPE